MGRMPRSALGRVSMPQAKQEPDTRSWNIADLRAVCLVMVQRPSCGRHSKAACSCPPDECSQVSLPEELLTLLLVRGTATPSHTTLVICACHATEC